ncbi:protein LUTEIN DEFICIENT 5, chloroplastic [Amaranthus tricolor]|uniref:protein LUTEIN DEFICIENT 5, chloroplastic n=1 Tax=Amaranthus tricolor TaxID=29722 RepID=UPI002586A8B0|nr:protein LUTEIN DEFICIENT 5, chloroplastic [Amaranthus tricolor]
MAAHVSTFQSLAFSSHPFNLQMNLLHFNSFNASIPSSSYSSRSLHGGCKWSLITCSSSNGSRPDPIDDGVKSIEEILAEKRRAELTARIASGEFTVKQPSLPMTLRKNLSKLAIPTPILDFIFKPFEDYEKFSRIPEAKGEIAAIRSEAFFLPLYDLYLTYGGVFRLKFGPKAFLIVSDPKVVKHILKDNSKAYSKGILAEILDFVMGKGLIPADGEIWRVRRRAIVPALHQKFVTAMIGLFCQATDRLCKKLDAASTAGEAVEMESLFSHLTLDIIGKAVFNYDFDSLSNDTGIVEAVYTVLREAEARSTAPIPVWEIPIWKDVSPRLKKVNAALKLVNDTLNDLIAICKRMVEEEELQFHEEYMNEQDPSILHFLLASGDDVSSKQLRDDLMTLLIAGHETSAAVLTWTFYLLSQNPGVVEKLRYEVDTVLGERFPTIQDLKNLKYASRVISESLRLYPQPPVLIRRSLEEDMLGPYPIKKGEDIFISVWNLHRSPSFWDDADKFIPERWPVDGPAPNETNQNFKYLPFGGGPRKCIGDMFASYENVVALAMLIRQFDFELAPDAPPVKMTTGATIHTTNGLMMSVRRRTNFHPTDPKIPVVDTASPANVTEAAMPNGSKEGIF